MYPVLRGLTALILVALPLAAYATPGDRQLEKISAATERLWAEYDACMSQVERTAEFQRLDRAFILKRNDPRSVEKMAIDRHADDQEKVDLLENKKNTSQCYQHLFKSFTEVNPRFTVLLVRFISEDNELVLQTVQDDVTIGTRNLIIEQHFVERLRDWSFTGERIYVHTWHLRRPCSIYCSSWNAASFQQASTEGLSNNPRITPTNGQAAEVLHFWKTKEPLAQDAEVVVAPAASKADVTAEPPIQAAETVAAPAASEAEIATKPSVQAAETTTAPEASESQTNAESPPQETEQGTVPTEQTAEIATKPPAHAAETDCAPTTQVAETNAESAPQEAELGAAPTAQEAEIAAKPLVQVAETDTALAAPEAQTTAEAPPPQEVVTATAPAARMADSALEAPTQEVDTGLKPAAGPTDESAEPRKQRIEIATAAQTAEPRYTIHLASMRSEMEARAEWGQLQSRYPDLLGDRVLFTREIRISGEGTFVRVLTGLFRDHHEAIDLCSQFSGDDQYCAVLKLEASAWIVP